MWLNLLSLAVFALINVSAAALKRCMPRTAKNTLRAVLAVLFFGNLFRYVYAYPKLVGEIHIPIEYSTVAYFLVPPLMFLDKGRCRVWASMYGLTAGFLYYMAMIIAANKLYADAPLYDVCISYFCHGALYLNGVVVLSREKVNNRDAANMMLCLLIISIRALVLKKYAVDADELFIYDVLGGNVMRMVMPESSWHFTVPLYYIVLNLVIVMCLKGFLPKKARKKRVKGNDAVSDTGD